MGPEVSAYLARTMFVFGITCAIGGVAIWKVCAWLIAHITIGWTP